MCSLRVKYKTYEFDKTDIHLRTLRDTQEFEDLEGVAEKLGIPESTWALFGVLWPSGEVLARLMSQKNVDGLRILEIGCGIALPSLILNSKGADISATDYHPLSDEFLVANTALNSGKKIPFYLCDWNSDSEEAGKYDLIIGSDVLYERDHVKLLSRFLEKHANPICEIILVDPGRGNMSHFKKEMIVHGFEFEVLKKEIGEEYKGQIVRFSR